MDVTKKEFSSLCYMERWATYRSSDGALSLDQVIREDQRRNFSTLLSEEETLVRSFTMNDIPEADALLVLGSPRALAYAAEIAVRYRDRYGNYPELFSVGDGRGMFTQRRPMNAWFQEQLVALGFPEEWARQNVLPHANKNWEYLGEVNTLILRRMSYKRRFRVLVVTGVGCSLNTAMQLYSAIPHTDFFIFETPQSSLRIFDCELFTPKSYGIDLLLAQIVKNRMGTDKMKLPVEKLLGFPRIELIQDLLYRGYAGFFNHPKMWKCVGINPEIGKKLHKDRIAQLQQTVRPCRFEEQTEKLLDAIRKKFQRKGLIIRV